MSLWGATDADESKPKHLTAAQKKEVYASTNGWVIEAGSAQSGNSNTGANPIILVAGGSFSRKFGAADITEIEFISTALDKSAGFTLSMRVRFNEPVAVTGTPQFLVTNNTAAGRNLTCDYSAGSGTNELTFVEPVAANNAATNASDVLKVAANPVSLNSGTITDLDFSTLGSVAFEAATGGFSSFPTCTLANSQNSTHTTTAALGAVTAKIQTVAIHTAGSGHAAGDVLTIANAFGTGTNATFTVASVTGGAVTGLTITNDGAYTAIGTNTTTGCTNIATQSTTGSGSGTKFTVTLAVESIVITTAGVGYTEKPAITVSAVASHIGVGAQNATPVMLGAASTITSAAGIGTAAGTLTVVA
ncbi:hypothetical protein N9159_00075 [bacterium]|jgi:hypothetical protein|nr:hypothetical protein [bacterium]